MPYRNNRQSWALQRAKRFLAPLRKVLKTGDDHDTFDRLFNSRHVADLQVIAGLSFAGVLVIVGAGFLVMSYTAVQPVLLKIANSGVGSLDWSVRGALAFWASIMTAFQPVLTVIAPVLAVYGAVVAWAYQMGSARLGVVDSFACEMGTLCRSMLVVDAVGRNIERFNRPPRAGAAVSNTPNKEATPVFISQENYFPVFENGTKDLQVLEAKVVVNITAFYTFMKVVRDSMRGLAEIRTLSDGEGSEAGDGMRAKIWREKVRDLIYMMFLGLESARRALNVLVEYEPDHDELLIVVLISELRAYSFLCRQFAQEQDVLRYGQLMLRRPVYEEWVTNVCKAVESGRGTHKDWERAYRFLPELKRQYQDASGGNSGAAAAGA